MSNTKQLSQAAKTYLCHYYSILDNMIEGMTSAALTDSISHNFIVQMIPHHEAAIQMSQNILQYTSLAPLQAIARNIISEQTKSIQNMQAALRQCSALTSTHEDLFLYNRQFQRVTQEMFRQMQEAPAANNINADFLREMIPHHKGAIRMSENALRFPICPELVPILQAIITSQKKGVQEMERLLRYV